MLKFVQETPKALPELWHSFSAASVGDSTCRRWKRGRTSLFGEPALNLKSDMKLDGQYVLMFLACGKNWLIGWKMVKVLYCGLWQNYLRKITEHIHNPKWWCFWWSTFIIWWCTAGMVERVVRCDWLFKRCRCLFCHTRCHHNPETCLTRYAINK